MEKAEKLTYSVAEAAAKIGICLTNTQKLVRAGKLKSLKVGRRYLISKTTILNFIEQSEKIIL